MIVSHITAMKLTSLLLLTTLLVPALRAEEPAFKSELFKTGSLLYTDDFDGEFNREFWETRTKSWEVNDGTLAGKPDYDNAEEAMAALNRDHHLGMSPVIRLNQLPEKFVLHLRIKYEGTEFSLNRPKFDIGHHINLLAFTKTGYTLALYDGEVFKGEAPEVKLNEWLEIVLEFEEGRMFIKVNGAGQTIEHEQVSLQGHSELTFKTFEDTPNRILIDSVTLWSAE
tara:strand:- start:71 stop:748 length:678 start_codon:yes stop_codon:yes gene_type:complete